LADVFVLALLSNMGDSTGNRVSPRASLPPFGYNESSGTGKRSPGKA
jgi:hypothetical protein